MRYAIVLGAAALVAASPAPQAFDPAGLDAGAALTQGPPVGVGPAQQTAYSQSAAQVAAAAAVTGAATVQAKAKRSTDDLEKRNDWWWWPQQKWPTSTSTTSTAKQTTPPTTTQTPAPSTTSIVVPSTCTPVSWTNTNAFTTVSACPTAIEVGTYCGFINPEDPCAPQPAGAGTPPTDDTVSGFLNNAAYKQMAVSAKTPSGYVQSFVNLQASVSGNGYLSYKTLNSYDVAGCSQFCDQTSTCTGFNIFIERDPAWNPSQCSCANPPSTINYKCSIWGQNVTAASATNTGGSRDGFQVVITGSNGYNKGTYTPPSPPSCSNPQSCGGKLHNQPRYCMGQKTFPGPWDPSLCAAYAQKQNDVNRAKGLLGSILSLLGLNKGGCVQFQAAYLEESGKGFGTHCRLFTQKFTPPQATLDISVGNSGWGCHQSYTYDVDVNASFNWGGWSWKN